ncbi:MAG: helix-hairpin-helix domain-containing protein [Bacteroidota bacterium]
MSWHRFTEQLREYFTFTRKERNGIVVLLILLIAMQGMIVITHFYKPQRKEADITAFRNEVLVFEQAMLLEDSSSKHIYIKKPEEIKNITLFEFDPNIIDEQQWKSLGLGERTIHSIRNYISKGGHFYKKEDFKKIYNLDEKDYLRLEPYISITGNKPDQKNKTDEIKKPKELVMVEINSATLDELMKLPMVGEKRAEQIMKYRNRLGGFVTKEQLSEVFSIPDSIYQIIAPHIALNISLVQQIKINSITSDSLYHPYLKKNLLKLIISYRNQHGAYTTKLDLKKLPLMTDSVYRKLEPYMGLE